ncbi:MAG: hypothetical protein IPO53_11795 [Chitinophagaceae bacterium]|nr:hypothetical protein [Chitinophagaceae bacterium]
MPIITYPGSWQVTDENGTKYTFEAKGGSSTNYSSSYSAGDTSFGYPSTYYNYNPIFALTQIENIHGEKIYLYYTTECYQYRLNDQDEYRDYTGGSQCNYTGDGFFSPSHKEGGSEVCDPRIDSISTTNGQVVVFNYSSRSDLIGASKFKYRNSFFKVWYCYYFYKILWIKYQLFWFRFKLQGP